MGMLDPQLAQGMNARLGFRFGEATYVARLHNGVLDIERHEIQDCDVEFAATPGQLAAVVYGGAPLETLDVKGDMELAKRFTTLFPLPPKAE